MPLSVRSIRPFRKVSDLPDEQRAPHGPIAVMDEQEAPPPSLGNYPHGLYWSAFAPEGEQTIDEDEEDIAEGSDLRIMWDEGAGPLWGSGGLLPYDPDWLQRALGLSQSLVADLFTWLGDMTALHRGAAVDDWLERLQQLDERKLELVERLRTEVGNRYRVWHP